MTPRRSRSRRAARVDKAVGLVLAVIGIMLIGGLSAVAWVVTHKPRLDAKTNCPTEGPNAIHLILIDQSDPITPLQAQRVRNEMKILKSSAPPGTRFDVFAFQGDTSTELYPLVTVCASKRDANEFIENPKHVRKRYDELFSDALDKAVDELIPISARPNSPILESLRAAAQTSFGLSQQGQLRLRVTLVSDMVQHSTDLSHFRSEPSMEHLARSPKWPLLRPTLKGADVDILYISRPTALRDGKPIQNRGHQLFWERLIAEAGGRVTSIEPF